MMSGVNIKPSSGWIHPDKLIAKQGATYTVRYVGCLEVKVSVKTLDFKTRLSVANECINRVCETSGLKSVDKKRKVDQKVLEAIADVPNFKYAGMNVNLNVSNVNLSLTSLDTNQVIAIHEMPRISFASGGASDTLDFVAYIAKDANDLRACYVLECGGGLAKDVISTIGEAFELRFQQFTNKAPITFHQFAKKSSIILETTMGHPSTFTGDDADKDYYNDMPGKVPPSTTLVQSPNLIGLRSDILNDPFAELLNEIWFHGRISRADAENLLQKDGDFLVRELTNTAERQFVLSGMQDSNKKHLLLIDPEGVVRTKDRMFNSVSHLIQFYYENALPIISEECALVLQNKIPRNR